jgi:hypothetical protein
MKFRIKSELKIEKNRKLRWKNKISKLKILKYYKRITETIFVFF